MLNKKDNDKGFGRRLGKGTTSGNYEEAARALGAGTQPSTVTKSAPERVAPMMIREMAPMGQRLAPASQTHVDNVFMLDRRLIALGENVGRGGEYSDDDVLLLRADIKNKQVHGIGIDGCGIEQNLGVRPLPPGRIVSETIDGVRFEKTHELVWGARRFLSTQARPDEGDPWSLPYLPVTVQNLSDAEAAAASLSENSQRVNASPAQIGKGILILQQAMQRDIDALCEKYGIVFIRRSLQRKAVVVEEDRQKVLEAIKIALSEQNEGTRTWMSLVFERALQNWLPPRVFRKNTTLVTGMAERTYLTYLRAAKIADEVEEETGSDVRRLTHLQLMSLEASADAEQKARSAKAATQKNFTSTDIDYFASLTESVQEAILDAPNFYAHHLDALRRLKNEDYQRRLIREIDRRMLSLGAASERASEFNRDAPEVAAPAASVTAPVARPGITTARWSAPESVAPPPANANVNVNVNDAAQTAHLLTERANECKTLALRLEAQCETLAVESKQGARYQKEVAWAAEKVRQQLRDTEQLLAALSPVEAQ